MKFTDGFWEMKPEFTPYHAAEIRDFSVDTDHESYSNSVTLYCPFKRAISRGDTLNTGQLTVTCSSPFEDVIRIKVVNFAGLNEKNPQFKISDEKTFCDILYDESTICLKTGKLQMKCAKYPFSLSFFGDGKRITGIGYKSLSMMKRNDGTRFLNVGLDLSVGELIYGLGERFTQLVKNGQVIDIWNEDGGTSSQISYKNIPFYMTNSGYGVFVNTPGKISFEVASEKVEQVEFSVMDEEVEFFIIYGPTPKEVLKKYTYLTGRPAVPPPWSFGLWLSTSFTTDYDEDTINSFLDGMEQRRIPLSVFHFDCFWMKEYQWCNFEWDRDMFPDPVGMLERLKNRGLKVCVWINPYIAQKSPLFKEGKENGYLLLDEKGNVFQWDRWQAGMGLVDFTNPKAVKWFQSKLEKLLDMGVDCFKTDFGERIPVDVKYYDGSNPEKMHNYYTYLYNKCVFELLLKKRGHKDAVVFARSATATCQQFPVHWGGDCTASYISMAESLRGGLSLASSGFGFWSHDIGGFESESSPDIYKRWIAFGLLSSHSRLHGSTSYRVPWNYDEESCGVLNFFTRLKCSLMPYIYDKACEVNETGVPLMRPMHVEFPEDFNCGYLERQYMFGDRLLVAPVFSEDHNVVFYLPEGSWTHLLSNKKVCGGKWIEEEYDYFSLPLFVRENSIVPIGAIDDRPDYDYKDGVAFHVFELKDRAQASVRNLDGKIGAKIEAIVHYKDSAGNDGKSVREKSYIQFKCDTDRDFKIVLRGIKPEEIETQGAKILSSPEGTVLLPINDSFKVYFK